MSTYKIDYTLNGNTPPFIVKYYYNDVLNNTVTYPSVGSYSIEINNDAVTKVGIEITDGKNCKITRIINR